AHLSDLGVGRLQLVEVALELFVQAAVLDRDGGLVGDDLEDGDVQLGEGIDSLARDGHGAHYPLGRRQRLNHQRGWRAALGEHREATSQGGGGDVELVELHDRVAEDAFSENEARNVQHHVAVGV